MKILGIDPGYERLGVAIIDKNEQGKELVLFSDCIKTSAKLDMSERLFEIGQALSSIIKKYQPHTAVIEQLYFAKNTKTAMAVAEARGVIQYICKEHGLSLFEYHPNQIKIAITGNGRADKTSIAYMIPKLVRFDVLKKLDDEIDAIAVALTHIAHKKI